MTGEADEPPDEPLSPLHVSSSAVQQEQQTSSPSYKKSAPPRLDRKESLLTRALSTGPNSGVSSPLPSPIPGPLSRASTMSNASMPSMSELTSDGYDTSPNRSATPSPPFPSNQFHPLETSNKIPLAPTNITFVTNKEQVMPTAVDLQESKVEANLGRKRAIKFACAAPPTAKETPPVKDETAGAVQPPKRKSAITFACPFRPTETSNQIPAPPKSRREGGSSPTNDSTAHSKDKQHVGDKWGYKRAFSRQRWQLPRTHRLILPRTLSHHSAPKPNCQRCHLFMSLGPATITMMLGFTNQLIQVTSLPSLTA